MNNIFHYKQASATLSLQEKVGQLFMPAAFINDSEEEIQELEKLIQDHHIGGLCFFHSRASAATNFETKKKIIYNQDSFNTLKALIKRYQNISKYPLLISIDAEWGLAMRIENTPQYPYAITLGAIQGHSALLFEVGKNIAHDCKQAGIHYNLSPVVDINDNPNNPVIGYRSFGENKTKVTDKAIAFVEGTQSEGVLTSIKHFPGHGDTDTDSHLGLPVINKSKKELLDNELYPFRELIDKGIDSVMVGHLSVPSLANGSADSSSLSKDIIKGVLRKELGYKGVVISDALNMHAVSKNHPTKGELEWLAFDAGNDILCFAEHISEGMKAIIKYAAANQIEESFERVWKLKEKAFKTITIHNSGLLDPSALNAKIARQSITLFKGTKSVISAFRRKGFIGFSNSRFVNNHFFDSIKKGFDLNIYSLEEDLLDVLKNEDNVLLSLFPPQVKPTGNFGFTNTEIELINELFNSKNVVLYLFGNPYALKIFDYTNASAIVLVYQEFKEFQEVAVDHFFERINAKGKLPVAL